MRGRFNGGYTGSQQLTNFGIAKGVYNMVEVQQYSGARQWPVPPEDFYFNYVSALFHGDGGAPVSPLTSTLNTTNFNDDFSTNNFLLEVFGDVRGDKFNPFEGNFYSNYFDGTGDYLSWSGPTVGTNPYCFECWFYANGAISSVGIVGGTNTGCLNLRLASATSVQVDSHLVSNSLFTVNTILSGVWNHFVVCRDSSNRTTVFINGIRSSTGATTVTTNYSGATDRLGSSGTVNFTGYIYDARLIVGSTPYDPTQSTITVPSTLSTAVANTNLLTCRTNRFLDLSNNSSTLTRNGDVVVTPYIPGFAQNLISQTTFTDNELYKMTDGYYGVGFDGNLDYLDQSVNAAYGFGTGDYTIECFFIQTAKGSANDYYLIDFRTAGNATAVKPVLYISTSIGNKLIHSVGATTRIEGPIIPLNVWYHVALVKSGGTTTLYVNGISQGTTTTNDDFGSDARPVIGNVGDAAGSFNGSFAGIISNVRVVKGTAVYTSNFTPNTTPLTVIANTSLLTCRSNTVNDISNNNFTITKNGNAEVSLSHPFGNTAISSTEILLQGSTYCDGTGDYLRTNLSSEFTIGNNDFTIDFWVYIASSAASRRDFVDIIAGSGFNRILIYFSGSALLYAAGDTVAATTRITGATIPGGQWHHVALSRSGGSSRLFLNGLQTGSTFADTLNWTSTMRAIVGFGQGGTTPHLGYISNVRILNGTALYKANFIPPTAPSTALTNTRLLTSQRYDPSYNSQFKDSSYQNNIVTRNGNVAAGSFSPYGTNNWSVYFDGSGDYLTAPDSTNWDFGTGDFTIELWVKYNVSTGDQCWVSQYQDTTTGWTFRNGHAASNTQFYVGDTAIFDVTDPKQDNTWTHYAVSRQGTSLKVFKNGLQLGSTITNSTNFTSTSSLFIGSVNASAWFMNGFISNLRILKGTALYTSNFSVPTGPLTAIANTVLLTCQSNRFIDNGPNNITLTRAGDSRILRFGPFVNNYVYDLGTFGGSAWFDGTGDYLTVSRLTGSVLGASNWTIECWFYATDTRTSVQIIGNRSSASGSTAFVPIHIAFESSTIRFFSSTNGTSWNINNATTIGTVNLRSWNHVAVVRNGANIDGYLNGTKVSLNTNMTGTYTGTNLFYASTAETLPFFGFIADYRLVVGEAVYTNSFTPPTAPLQTTANTTFLLSMSDAGQYDNGMSGNWESMGGAQSTQSLSKFGRGSLYFDGTGDYLYSPYYPHMYLGTTFTIEMWVYHVSRGASAQAVYDQAVTVTTNFAYQGVYISTAGALQFQVRPTTGGAVTTVSGGTIPLTTWTHIAVCCNNSTIRLYVGGLEVGTPTAVTLMAASLPNGVGIGGPGTGSGASSGASFNGYIDDVRVTRGVERYNGNFNVPLQQFNDR